MKLQNILIFALLITILLFISGCSTINSAVSKLENEGYTLEESTEKKLDELMALIPSLSDTLETQYKVYDDSGHFAGYILVLSSKEAAQNHYDSQNYVDTMEANEFQKWVVYKNLIVSGIDDFKVIEIVTGESMVLEK